MKTILVLLGSILTCHAVSAVSVVSGSVINPANGHSYYVLSPATWNDAESFSQSLGGHLLTINNAAENNWVYANLISGHPDLNPWTGLNDIGTPGIWHWISGEAVTFLNFAPGEPNGIGSPPYGVNIFPDNPYPSFAGQWNDAPLYDVIPGIAEVPEPSALSIGLLAIGLIIANGGFRSWPRITRSLHSTRR